MKSSTNGFCLDKCSIIPLLSSVFSAFYANHSSVVKKTTTKNVSLLFKLRSPACLNHFAPDTNSANFPLNIPETLRRSTVLEKWGVSPSRQDPDEVRHNGMISVHDFILGRNHTQPRLETQLKQIFSFSLKLNCIKKKKRKRKTHHQRCFVLPFDKCFICLQRHRTAVYGNDQFPSVSYKY